MNKCLFGATKIVFHGRIITPAGAKPQRPPVQNFLENIKFPKSKKALQRDFKYYLSYNPRFSEKLTLFFKLLKQAKKIPVTPDQLKKIT